MWGGPSTGTGFPGPLPSLAAPHSQGISQSWVGRPGGRRVAPFKPDCFIGSQADNGGKIISQFALGKSLSLSFFPHFFSSVSSAPVWPSLIKKHAGNRNPRNPRGDRSSRFRPSGSGNLSLLPPPQIVCWLPLSIRGVRWFFFQLD